MKKHDPVLVCVLYKEEFDTLVEYRQYSLEDCFGFLVFYEDDLLPEYPDEMICYDLNTLIRSLNYENMGVLYEQK